MVTSIFCYPHKVTQVSLSTAPKLEPSAAPRLPKPLLTESAYQTYQDFIIFPHEHQSHDVLDSLVHPTKRTHLCSHMWIPSRTIHRGHKVVYSFRFRMKGTGDRGLLTAPGPLAHREMGTGDLGHKVSHRQRYKGDGLGFK